MKRYDEETKTEWMICNCCGQKIARQQEYDRVAVLTVSKVWGYFSKWDGSRHSFDICEDCYEKMIQSWKYPPDREEETELL
jgi:protein-arginine kinase activator protein McsA